MPERSARMLVHLTDLHVPAEGLLHDRVDALARVRTALAAVARAGRTPDLVLLTGDLADAGDPRSYARLRPVLEAGLRAPGAPVLVVPGNHDDRAAMTDALPWPVGDRVVRLGGLRVIGLDTTVAGAHHGELGEDQLAWLARELDAPAAEGTILALHHAPLRPSTPASGLLGLRDPERLAAVLTGRDVRLVVGGHTHRASCGTLAGLPVWVTPSTAVQAGVGATDAFRTQPGGGFARIDVFAQDVVVTAVPIDGDGDVLHEVDVATIERALARG